MTNKKITELTELSAAPETTDIIAIVDDPGGSPVTKKITVANLTSGLGGGDFTERIPCVLEVPNGTVAYPDIHSNATAGIKISGFVLPDGASASTINFKVGVPDELNGTPAASIKIYFLSLAAGSSNNVRITVSTAAWADTENTDQALTAETEVTEAVPDTIESLFVLDQDMTNDPVAGDYIFGTISRDPTDGVDDYAGDIMVIAAYLEIERTGA